MLLEDYFEFPDKGEIKLKGHRIWAQDVLHEYILRDLNLEELEERFDTLSREEILATLLYYHHNKEAMDKYLANLLEYSQTEREKSMKEHPEWYEKMRRLVAERLAEKKQVAP